jgi:hypothetical protein
VLLDRRRSFDRRGGVTVSDTPTADTATFPCAWSGEDRSGEFLLIDDHNDEVWVSRQAWDDLIEKSDRERTLITFKVLRVTTAEVLCPRWYTRPGWTRAHPVVLGATLGAENYYATRCGSPFPLVEPEADLSDLTPSDLPHCIYCTDVLAGRRV